ncbi:MAG: MlaE family ABC transporter permease [Elusimicrobiales bacterium]|nr:ABC transporter permease [Elusimicrobiales bacterium]HOL63139.1 ABC transporter permease [Elusimicrobiales bacterium]HPO95305.1 ABC transporter permease [Elusimicrobiales bacterium]
MNPISRLGEISIKIALHLGRTFFMVKNVLFWLFHSKLEKNEIFKQTVRIGVDSLGVTTLTSLFTGMVLALQSGYTSKNLFNEPLYVGTVVGFSLVKELAPVLTAIVVSGRAGSSVTAEIGTMAVTEQIDALYTLGTNPSTYLLIPRYFAFIIALPILTVFANIVGIFGGFLVSSIKLSIPSSVYFDDILQFMEVKNFMHGFIKTFFFAFTIATVSCYKGLYTEGGAEGVGRATTNSVVLSMILILAIDYFVSSFLVLIGIT